MHKIIGITDKYDDPKNVILDYFEGKVNKKDINIFYCSLDGCGPLYTAVIRADNKCRFVDVEYDIEYDEIMLSIR